MYAALTETHQVSSRQVAGTWDMQNCLALDLQTPLDQGLLLHQLQVGLRKFGRRINACREA